MGLGLGLGLNMPSRYSRSLQFKMSKFSRKIQADKGMTEGVSHFKTADWSRRFECKFLFSLTSKSVSRCFNNARGALFNKGI